MENKKPMSLSRRMLNYNQPELLRRDITGRTVEENKLYANKLIREIEKETGRKLQYRKTKRLYRIYDITNDTEVRITTTLLDSSRAMVKFLTEYKDGYEDSSHQRTG